MKSCDVRVVAISHTEMEYIKRMARKAAIGGKSRLRDEADRTEKLMQDQEVGMAGQLAVCKYWTGSLDPFKIQRHFANLYRFQGDGGADIPGSNIDVKASRKTNENLLAYHLWVRSAEYKTDTVYILAIVHVDMSVVNIIGWASGAELIKDSDDRYSIAAANLHPLPPILWRW